MTDSTPTEALITALHTDPELFVDVPSDTQIIEGNPELKKSGRQTLTPGERQGFLEMWRVSKVQAMVADLEVDELQEIVTEYEEQADEFRAIESRIFDMRFLANAARSRLSQTTSPIQAPIIQEVREV